MTQTTLATRVGLDRTYVSGIELGKKNPSLACALALAGALDVKTSELIALAEDLR